MVSIYLAYTVMFFSLLLCAVTEIEIDIFFVGLLLGWSWWRVDTGLHVSSVSAIAAVSGVIFVAPKARAR